MTEKTHDYLQNVLIRAVYKIYTDLKIRRDDKRDDFWNMMVVVYFDEDAMAKPIEALSFNQLPMFELT